MSAPLHVFNGCLEENVRQMWFGTALSVSFTSQRNMFRKDFAFNLYCPASDSGAVIPSGVLDV